MSQSRKPRRESHPCRGFCVVLRHLQIKRAIRSWVGSPASPFACISLLWVCIIKQRRTSCVSRIVEKTCFRSGNPHWKLNRWGSVGAVLTESGTSICNVTFQRCSRTYKRPVNLLCFIKIPENILTFYRQSV